MRRAIPFAKFGGMIAALVILGGCVTSASSRYQHHLDSTMQGEDSPPKDVAAAFGLNQNDKSRGAMVANAPDQ